MSSAERIRAHRSIRKYQNRPIDGDLLHSVLETGIRASSSGNMQAFSIIVTTDTVLKNKLHSLHFQQDMVLQAPVLLTFCSDFHRMRRWLRLNQAPDNFDNFMSFMIGAIDAVLVSQNVALAAEENDLGICYLGTTLANCLEISKLLQLPKNVVPVTGMVLGYPAENPPLRDRLPLEGLVHQDHYRHCSDEELKDIYREREQKGWARYQSDPEIAEAINRKNLKNLAQIYTAHKYTQASHVDYSQTLLNCLVRQDFWHHPARPRNSHGQPIPNTH
jgi:nitroreductase